MSSQIKKQWWNDAVIYQVYPRSFNDSNGDGVGDLPGIIEKLPYIQGLGVNVIWLSPVYSSPMKDNGYDISDYYNIAPEFGTMDDMDTLIEEALKLGIKIIMDLVVNHTSDQHPWFIEAKTNPDSDMRDFYIWRDPSEDGSEPNNWQSFFCPKAWTKPQADPQYYLHLFSPEQPDLNWANPKLRQAVYQMMRFWLDKGLGGFRMDVINMIGKPHHLPDASIFGQGVAGWEHWANTQLCHEYLREMHEQVLDNYDVMTVGETPFTSPTDGQLYSHPDRKELSMVFQFEHMAIDRDEHDAISKGFDLVKFKEIMGKWQSKLHNKGWNSLYWSNHDQARAVSRFGNDSPQYRELSAKMLATTLHMMSGTPYIYQGEELGMTNKHFERIDDLNDLMGHFHYQKMLKRGIPAKQALDYLNHFSRDHARVPMQWDSHKNAGFTNGEPWIALNDNYPSINASLALQDTNSIYYYYQQLVRLRRQSPYRETLVYGAQCLLDPLDSEVYSYIRCFKARQLLVVSNFSEQHLDRKYRFDVISLLLSNYPQLEKQPDIRTLKLRPYESIVFEVSNSVL